MALTKLQLRNLAKAQLAGAGGQGIPLDTRDCTYLLGVIVSDLELFSLFPELDQATITPFFETLPTGYGELPDSRFLELYERLIREPDVENYFLCLARLYKSRLKYERILETQPIPTMDQVGPRGLLQFGLMSPATLAYFMFWRKWTFDIDNRAGQETGYLFEPILASVMGGISFSASTSPIRRHKEPAKGRQVDCILPQQKLAYEMKIRVTIAASGQGRWQEELEFPIDCRQSGYTPMLIVLDQTDDPKLAQLRGAFEAAGGGAFVGQHAWAHLHEAAGAVMSSFLHRYIHVPLESLLGRVPAVIDGLPEIRMVLRNDELRVHIGEEAPFIIDRSKPSELIEAGE